MLTTILTYQPDQPKPTNTENFYLMCFLSGLDKIWYGANNEPEKTWDKFEMAAAVF